jgi:hypothetical protein
MRSAWVVVLTAACSFERGVAPETQSDATVGFDDAAVDAALGAWSMPVEITELSSGYGEDDASLTADLREIYFGSKRPSGLGYEDIWRATRESPTAAWSAPMHVPELSSASIESTAKITADGLAIFFTSTREGNADLYFATRETRTSTWSNPARIESLSSSGGDWGPAARSDLLHLVWCAGTTVPEEALYVSARATKNAMWNNPARLAELDELSVSECDPMEANARTLYFASDRGGKYDIYRAARTADTGPYGPLAPISTINVTAVDDRDPWVSTDERYLVFTSNRTGVDRLYVSSR